MKKFVSIFILLVMCQGLLLGQTEIVRSYEISEYDYPQRLVLIEYEDGSYEGYLSTKITRVYQGKREEVADKYYLENLKVLELMKDLKDIGIEEWKNCDSSNNCNTIYFLKSRFFSIKIQHQSTRKKDYLKIEQFNEESFGPLRNQGMKFMKTVEKYVNFYTEFQEVFRRLPEGTYEWLSIKESSIGILNSKE